MLLNVKLSILVMGASGYLVKGQTSQVVLYVSPVAGSPQNIVRAIKADRPQSTVSRTLRFTIVPLQETAIALGHH